MSDCAIEVKNLTKKFGKFVSVNNISFNVKKGEIFGFLGANGNLITQQTVGANL